MVYPDAGITISAGSAWSTSIPLGTLTDSKACSYTTLTGISCDSVMGDNETAINRLATSLITGGTLAGSFTSATANSFNSTRTTAPMATDYYVGTDHGNRRWTIHAYDGADMTSFVEQYLPQTGPTAPSFMLYGTMDSDNKTTNSMSSIDDNASHTYDSAGSSTRVFSTAAIMSWVRAKFAKITGTGIVERIGAAFDGGGSAIALNKIVYTHVPFAVTSVDQWTVICDQDSGTNGIVITPYMDAFATDTLPTTTMCTTGTAPNTSSGATAGGTVKQATWDCNITAIPADRLLAFKVTTAPSSATWCSVTLKVTR